MWRRDRLGLALWGAAWVTLAACHATNEAGPSALRDAASGAASDATVASDAARDAERTVDVIDDWDKLRDAAADDDCIYGAAPADGRMLGGDILDVNAGESFDDNLAELGKLRGKYLTLHLPWTALETTAGSGTTSGTLVDPGTPPTLATFDQLAAASGMKISLTLRPIDATGKTVPSDLTSVRFDDPALIARLNAMVDFVLSKLKPEHLVNLMIGNEIDHYDPGSDANFWSDYGSALAAVRAHVGTNSGLSVGTTATLDGWIDAAGVTADGQPVQPILQAYAGVVDAIGVTYYPLNDDFTMRAPSVVSADFAALLAAVPDGVPVHVQEIGYASAAVNGSSEAQQAAFYCEAMHAWDMHAAAIPRMAFLRLNDVTPAQARALAGPYGVTGTAFVEYLRTLGLRSADGAAKPARRVLENQAFLREL